LAQRKRRRNEEEEEEEEEQTPPTLRNPHGKSGVAGASGGLNGKSYP
jgi:hypothetical protein